MTGLARVGLVASRELSAERRQPDGAVAAVTFVAVLVLLESLVVGPSRARDATVAAAPFWIALAFAAIVVAMRSFHLELAGDAPAALAWSGILLAFALVYGVVGLTIVPAAIE